MDGVDSDDDGAMAPPRVAAPLLLRENLPTSPSRENAMISEQRNAFLKFQCKKGTANPETKIHELLGSQSVSQPSNGVLMSYGAGGKDSSRHDKQAPIHVLSKSRVLLSESPQSLDQHRVKQPRLGSLSSDTPFKRRLRAPVQSGPLLKRRLIISDDEDDAEEMAATQPPPRQSPAASPLADDDVVVVPDTPSCRTPIVVDLTTPAKGSPSYPVTALGSCSPTAAASSRDRTDKEGLSSRRWAEETPMQKCEAIATRIRAALVGLASGGSGCDSNHDGRGSRGDAEVSLDPQAPTASHGTFAFVSRDDVTNACGPGSAAAMLKPYQIVGLNWMLLLKRLGVGGCILADEMGLGKTASAVCFLGLLKAVEQDPGPHMVVVPASLLENWQRELRRWCPSLAVRTYHGPNRSEVSDEWDRWRRQEAEREDGSCPEAPPFDVLVTSYVYFERDSTDQRMDRKFFRRMIKHPTHPLSHILLDEAHAIKAKAAQRTVRLRALACACKRRIFLTGTPLQNDLEELQSLLSFLLPDVFGEGDGCRGAVQQEESDPEEDESAAAARMRTLLEPFLLRRLKSHVATQLVAKSQQVREVTMTEQQRQLYLSTVDSFRKSVGPTGVKALPKKAVKLLGTKKASNIFVQLRKVAQHPLLLRSLYTDATVVSMSTICRRRGDFGGEATQQQVEDELAARSDFALHHLCATSSNRQLQDLQLQPSKMRTSAKFNLLAELLPKLQASGSRPLIFSQWTSVLDLLEWLMQDLGLPFVRLDGGTAVAERLTIVDSFNRDTSIFAFLLSTRAGGQGLNLVGADTVILHDVDFNPQIDRQAEDRSHRLGQERPVTIYRLVTLGTVDEKINDIAQRKLKLDAAVLTGLGVTASSKTGEAAAERQAMSSILEEILQDKQLSSNKGSNGS